MKRDIPKHTHMKQAERIKIHNACRKHKALERFYGSSTRSRMGAILNRHDPKWTLSQMDTIPNGHNSERTQSRMDTIPNRNDPKCALTFR